MDPHNVIIGSSFVEPPPAETKCVGKSQFSIIGKRKERDEIDPVLQEVILRETVRWEVDPRI